MIIESRDLINHSAEHVYQFARDRITELVPYLPNIEKIIVIEASELTGEKKRQLNHWYSKAEIPAFAKKYFRPEVLAWKDDATWDDRKKEVDFRLESFVGADLFTCRGKNTFRPLADGRTELHVRCELEIHGDRVPGVPKLLVRQFLPAVEKFIVKIVEPNLSQLSQGLNRYFEQAP